MELKNIVGIDIVKASIIENAISVLGSDRCSLSDGVSWEELDIEVPAKMTVEDVIVDKDVMVKSTVTFRSCGKLDTSKPLCLRLHQHNGKMILVGNGKRPYNIGTYQVIYPDNSSDTQLYQYTFTCQAKTGPMMIS